MKLLDKEVKNKFKAGWKTIIFLIALYTCVYLFGLGLLHIFQIMGVVMLASMIWNKTWSFKPFIKLLIMFVVLSLLLYLVQPLGAWGGIIILAIFGTWILYNRWDSYLWAVKQGQKAIWGDTFENMKARGEKRPKLKFRIKEKKK